ncbi:hypothetical protein PE074_06435 [Wohlfahrtiimonas chitiniclastica]|uniref:hypothetical protein n=1 Tax=Wohlfahrtiimonas chitiniclastica TaxID=400946 RepID=UPI0009ED5581|nr:hypothetical protein [Wohlfahrtiimonas chitiniclastica]WHR54734.1 hypothetical protein PE074_06435 [Wohlfahrtiimonas chitiniclastica]
MGIAIGIDCSVNTGFAISQNQKLIVVTSYSILDAMDICLEYQDKDPILYIEDARKLRWGGYNKGNTARLQAVLNVIAKYGKTLLKSMDLDICWSAQSRMQKS